MEVHDELVNKLASLSRLTFNSEEKDAIKNDLQKMIGFIRKLEEINTEAVEPLLHISQSINVLREDIATNTCTTEEAIMNSPVHDLEYFKVPKVINK